MRRLHAGLAIAVLTVLLLSSLSDTIWDKQHQLQGLNGQIVATKTQIRQLLDHTSGLYDFFFSPGIDRALRAANA